MRTGQREEEALERRLRSQYEALYKQKCQSYCSMLESRYQTLKEAIEGVYKHIMADEVLAAMLNDRTTSAHVHQRIKEVFSEAITHEREIIFKKLGSQITNLKFENEQLQREVDKLRDSQQNQERNFTTERQTLQKTTSSTAEELRRTKEELERMREEIGLKREELRRAKEETQQWRVRYEQASEENKELRELVESLKEHHSQTGRSLEEVDEYKIKLRQAQNNVEELKTLLREAQEKAERKYQAKRKEYKQKIDSYKSIITQINQERLETQEAVRRQESQQASIQIERKVASLVKEHQRKMQELRLAKEKERAEVQRANEARIRECQTYFEKLLEQKVMEIQANAGRYFQRVREELSQENYLPRSTCEQQIGKRDEIVMLMKNKLEQFEGIVQDYHSRNQALSTRLKQSETALGAVKLKNSHLEEHSQQLIAQLKSYEQANNIFKLGDQKSKDQFTEYQRLLKKARDDQEEIKKIVIKLQQQRNHNQITIREKEHALKDALDENQTLLRKYKKLGQAKEEETRRADGLAASLSELKKDMAELQFKLKDKQMNSTLFSNSWENKLNVLQLELKEKQKLLEDIQEKYQGLSTAYQEEKKKSYEIDSAVKKYQMENKFYKEAAEMQKGESQATIEEYKRIITEKADKITSLQSELQKKNGKLNQLEVDLKLQKEKSSSDVKKLMSKVKKLSKVVMGHLETLRKENHSIVNYLKTKATIMQNEDSILRSTFHKELVHLHILNDREKQLVVRDTKAEANESASYQAKALKAELSQKLKEIQDKTEAEKIAFQTALKDKENNMDDMKKENKRLVFELNREKQEVTRLQKELEATVKAAEKEKESLEGKLQEMLREIKEERDIIVKNYEDKKYAMEQQISTLATNLKRLKTDTEIIQAQHQEEKSAINAQLRTIKEQQEVVHRVSQQKDQEIQRITKDYQASLQSKRHLENQSRNYADALNKKIQVLHELQIKQHQLTGEINLLNNKCERFSEENSELRRKVAQREEELEESIRNRARFESELKDIRGALSRSTKNQELRALNELSMETLQLSQKVNEMRKVNNYLDGKTPLRS